MTTILTTTGISLYRNTGTKHSTKTPTDDQMRQYLRIEPERASSEANSLLRMGQRDDRLVLLHTQTPEAVRCARLLRDYFYDEGYKQVFLIALEFQDDPKHIETTGLRNLIEKLIDEIEDAQKRGDPVVINATAGLKAQVVYNTMIGMIYQVPIKYIYEDFKSIVTFRPIEVEWDTSLFLMYEGFFKWFSAELRTQREVESYLRGYVDRDRIKTLLTPPGEDGYVFLSYMGNALERKFQREIAEAELVEWPEPASPQNPKKKIGSSILNRNHHPVDGDLDMCYKIAEIDCVLEIIGGNYEDTLRKAIKRVYPDGTILLLWADKEKAARFTIRTTAIGKPQTLKVAEKMKEILGIE